MNILSDDQAFLSIKDGSKMAYVKMWEKFKKYCNNEFKDRAPTEIELIDFFKEL